jgi:hypothetical protein
VVGLIAVLGGCSKSEVAANGRGEAGRSWQIQNDGTPAAAPAASQATALDTYSGTLVYDDPEWRLETDGGEYLLGLGNRSYLESTAPFLEPGMMAEVTGYFSDDELTVVTLTVDDKEVAFRNEDGAPLWAGRGASPGRAQNPDAAAGSQQSGQPRSGVTDPAADGEQYGGGPPEGRGPNGGGRGAGQGAGRGRSESGLAVPSNA